MPPLFDGSGAAVVLGAKVGEGGEGAVYEVAGRPDLVAKLYNAANRPDARKMAKLTAMVAVRTEKLIELTAWPVEVLRERAGGPTVGFLMAKLAGFKEMHLLYTPKSRLSEFPNASWEFLVHSAMNTAIVFNAVHREGHVIGDVNHGNIFVSQQATVRLIDCDSFQVASSGMMYLCEVGVATHTSPELQGKSFKSVQRTPNHDLFGLAVVIFQLLFLGRHPFSGVFKGKGAPPSLEEAITAFRFAYGRDAAQRQISPPPGGLGLDQLSPQLGTLFERAFAPQSANGQGRPSGEEWAVALKALLANLQACSANSAHTFLKGKVACPWCAFEVAAGRAMFNYAQGKAANSSIDVSALAAELKAVATPKPSQLSVAVPKKSPEQRFVEAASGTWRRTQIAIGFGASVASLGFLPAAQPYHLLLLPLGIAATWLYGTRGPRVRLREEAKSSLAEIKRQLTDLQFEWERTGSTRSIEEKRERLEMLIQQHRVLPQKRLAKLNELERQRMDSQKRQWLDRHRIRDAKIKDVGDVRKATLQSFNIETALDLTIPSLGRIPGFGPKTIQSLMAWRYTVEAMFRFNPTLQVNPMETRKVEGEIMAERLRIETELRNGPAALSQQVQLAVQRYAQLAERASELRARQGQMQANLAVCR